ncbi:MULTISPECIES: discoidin domain-containing protein [unclassified Pseudoalteromonas]|uniref:discoidin domain-containing protein n=1 Tax=unclassified Pseudoalteromonas TaxID=194690 RepID=UPI0030151577
MIKTLSTNDIVNQTQAGNQLSINAVTRGEINHVVFAYGDNYEFSHSERAAPYAMSGDGAGDFNAVSYLASLGEKHIRATAYDSNGTVISTQEVTLFISDTATESITPIEVEASSVLGNNGPMMAFDQNHGTRWESVHDASNQRVEWLTMDLGAMYYLTDMEILWETARSNDYEIKISNDGVAWQSVERISALAHSMIYMMR